MARGNDNADQESDGQKTNAAQPRQPFADNGVGRETLRGVRFVIAFARSAMRVGHGRLCLTQAYSRGPGRVARSASPPEARRVAAAQRVHKENNVRVLEMKSAH